MLTVHHLSMLCHFNKQMWLEMPALFHETTESVSCLYLCISGHRSPAFWNYRSSWKMSGD